MSEEVQKLAYVLAADVGNSRIALGCVQGDQVYAAQRVALDEPDRLGEALRGLWEAMEAPRRVVACSVNPAALAKFEQAVNDVLGQKVAVVGRDIPLPLETALAEPEKIGVDRLCCATAAYVRLEGPCVVADFGTAITIDYVDENGQFQGGAILPGLRMQAGSLHAGTAQLPAVELRCPDWVFGRNTHEAIVGGVVLGARGALRGLVESYAVHVGSWPPVICTGGDAELVVGQMVQEGFVQAVVPNLSLMGVALAFYKSLLPADQNP